MPENQLKKNPGEMGLPGIFAAVGSLMFIRSH